MDNKKDAAIAFIERTIKDKGIKKSKIAEECGLHPSTISQVLARDSRYCTWKVINDVTTYVKRVRT